MMMATPPVGGHTVTMTNREFLVISGVRQVESFDDEQVLLETTLGLLKIRGAGLSINQLNVEEEKLEVEGEITALEYIRDRDRQRGKGLLTRLLK
ncbi:MAG: sporulation protein YabP [Firmicutes bacterium]|nr:sporulation protein YabP [Bacillota bacterium]